MYVLTLTYIMPLEEVDRVRDAHMAWVAEQYEVGRFLVSGPRVPRDGGVILARQMDRDELDEVIASDPFTREGVAAYDVVEFRATTVVEELGALKERV
ncbi:YciI family protein [Conexibacter woesei]|uniref:YciI family protein n=1 Tax=Conexibacter woesei TaxID=191495 RepID=UPI00040BAF4D|nr:YciI family protein [Conexibacter woesei]